VYVLCSVHPECCTLQMPSSFLCHLYGPVNCEWFDFTILHSNLYSLRLVSLLLSFSSHARRFISFFFGPFIHSCQLRLICSLCALDMPPFTIPFYVSVVDCQTTQLIIP
jgi:hypothetical protein